MPNFNPAEARDWRGRWTKVGNYLRGTNAARAPTATDPVEIEKILNQLPKSGGVRKSINGAIVRTGPLRVRINGENRRYYSTKLAAQAIAQREHIRTASSPSELEDRASRKRVAAKTGVTAPREYRPAKLRYSITGQTSNTEKAIIDRHVQSAAAIQSRYLPGLVRQTSLQIRRYRRGSFDALGDQQESFSHGRTGINQRSRIRVWMNVMTSPESAQSLDYALNTNWWPPTIDRKYTLSDVVLVHEFGHGVHKRMTDEGFMTTGTWLDTTASAKELPFWDRLSDILHTDRPVRQYVPGPDVYDDQGQFQFRGDDVPVAELSEWFRHMTRGKDAFERKPTVRNAVSVYAESNLHEFFAELWCEYTLSSNPRPAAKFYGDYVMSTLGQIYGNTPTRKARELRSMLP
jgi:hypothetical protein